MIKKVGILTFHASHNYGSMLQAWALQTYLIQQGIEVEGINLRLDLQKNLYPNPMRFWGPKTILFRLKYPVCAVQEFKKWNKFESFLAKYIRTTKKEYHSWEEIRIDIPKFGFDAIICGGDQIWNTKCIDFDVSYYLPVENLGIKKISYSPSFGGDMSRFEDEVARRFIKQHLASFDNLSVRDKEGSVFLSELIGKEVSTVADPTLLLTASDYKVFFENRVPPKEDYIFYYSPFENKTAEKVAGELGERMNLPVITSNGTLTSPSNFRQMNSSGPIEFLWFIKNARFVCGYSYHLVVFSLLFHKDFAAIDSEKDSRIMGILSRCNLEMKASNNAETILSHLGGIDGDMIDKFLLDERLRGIEYLRSSLQ